MGMTAPLDRFQGLPTPWTRCTLPVLNRLYNWNQTGKASSKRSTTWRVNWITQINPRTPEATQEARKAQSDRVRKASAILYIRSWSLCRMPPDSLNPSMMKSSRSPCLVVDKWPEIAAIRSWKTNLKTRASHRNKDHAPATPGWPICALRTKRKSVSWSRSWQARPKESSSIKENAMIKEEKWSRGSKT